MAEGAMFNLSHSTAGKLLLANSNQQVRSMLIEHDPNLSSLTEVELAHLYAELDETQHTGLFYQQNALVIGVNDYSVLIGKPNAKVIAALTVSTFEHYQTEPLCDFKLVEALRETANKITQLIAET
ncbi:IclR family transcriptional regulator domain-containing protein [Shewanella gaetbuli]